MPVDPIQIVALFDQTESDRRVWENHWQEVADVVMPQVGFTSKMTPGSKRQTRIFDDTAWKAGDRLAFAIFSTTINPVVKWFGLKTRDQSVNGSRDVQAWLKDTADHLLGVFNSPRSGFSLSAHEVITDLVFFGTSVFMTLDGTTRAKFVNRPLSECYLVEDEEQRVNRVYRKFQMKLHEMAAMRGPGKGWSLSRKTTERLEQAKPEALASEDVTILHVVYERDEHDPLRRDGPNKRWASLYIEHEQKHVLKEGGFDRNPYKTPRWSKSSGETYGRSPAIKSLPSIKGLNVIKKTVLQAGEKAVDPPLQVPSNGMEGPIATVPGALIYYRAGAGGGNQGPITPLLGGDPRLGHQIVELERQNIRENFYWDILQLPELDRMTATEVMQRVQQRMTVLAPVLARMIGEWLSPAIEDTFFIEMAGGRLPPPPPEIAAAGLDIEYFGPLAIAQQASEANNIERLFNQSTPLLTVDPTAARVFNAPVIIRNLARFNNVHPDNLRSEQEFEAMQQQEQQLAALTAGAAAAKDAGSAIKDVATAGAL